MAATKTRERSTTPTGPPSSLGKRISRLAGERRARTIVAASLVVVAVVVALVILFWPAGTSAPERIESGPAQTWPEMRTEEQFLPGKLDNYLYHAPQTSDQTVANASELSGAEDMIVRALVPKVQGESSYMTMIVARYAPGSARHAENLAKLRAAASDGASPPLPAKKVEINGQTVELFGGPGTDKTPAALWQRSAEIDVYVSGGTHDELVELYGELIPQ